MIVKLVHKETSAKKHRMYYYQVSTSYSQKYRINNFLEETRKAKMSEGVSTDLFLIKRRKALFVIVM